MRLGAAWQADLAFGQVTRLLVEGTQAAAQHFKMGFQQENHLDYLGEKNRSRHVGRSIYWDTRVLRNQWMSMKRLQICCFW